MVWCQRDAARRRRLIQQRGLGDMADEAEAKPGEEARPPHPAPADGQVLAEPGNGQGRRIAAGAASRGIRGTHRAFAKGSSGTTWRDAGTDEKTSLATWERGAAGLAATRLTRSPP